MSGTVLTMPPLLLVLLLVAGKAAAWFQDDALHWNTREEVREEPVCYPFNYSCGLIPPRAPKSYEAHIEHVDTVYKTTHYMEEFYDYTEDMLAVTDSTDKAFTHTIFYFNINTAVFMVRERGDDGQVTSSCTVAEILHDSLFQPFPGINDTVHLVLAPSQALLIGGDYRYSYVNNGTIRGMECNRWDGCISGDKYSFYVEYYWTDPERTIDEYGYRGERPIRMSVIGKTQIQGSTTPINIDSMYSFAFFDNSPNLNKLREAFEIPNDMSCEGIPTSKQPPSELSEVYSMRVELTFQPSAGSPLEFVSTMKSWYDFYNRLTRTDSMTNPMAVEFAVAGLVEVASIRDFRAGVEYIIDKTAGNCSTIALTGTGYDTITTPDGQYTIKDPMLIFGLEQTNLTYHGVKYARGLPCDVWVGHMDGEFRNGTVNTSYTYEVYFLQSGWAEDAGAQNAADKPVPVFVSSHQDFSVDQNDLLMNIHQNIFKFDEELPDLSSVYDITPCFFGHDHIRRFQMAFPRIYRQYFERDSVLFTQEVRDGLINSYLHIPFIRLQHIQIDYSEKYNRLYCEFTLVDQPQVDMEFPEYVGPPLEQVVENLKDSMSDLTIVITDENGMPIMMTAIPDSLRELFEDGCYSRHGSSLPLHDPDNPPPIIEVTAKSHHEQTEHTTEEGGRGGSETNGFSAFLVELQQWARSGDDKRYTPGDMAGMAMGMLVLGLLLGSVVTLVILRKMGLSNDIEFIPMSSRRQ